MAEVKMFYDQKGNTLTVWFGDPQAEYVCEETGDEVILIKDKSGSVIGFERLNFSVADSEQWRVGFEVLMPRAKDEFLQTVLNFFENRNSQHEKKHFY